VLRTTAEAAGRLTFVQKGEFTIVLGPILRDPAPAQKAEDQSVADYFGHITKLGGRSKRQAAAETALEFGLSTNDVYALLERLKASSPS
jgi:hypothetical protein